MSRQILAYDDFDSPHATPPPQSDGRASSQRAPANGAAFHSGKELSPARHIGAGKKGKAEKRKQKQLQKQLHQGAKSEQGGEAAAAGEDESERKRKKRKFEESLEHDRVHWDAQGQREYGTVEVKYDDEAGDDDPTGDVSQLAPAHPQVKLEDALESMFDDAEKDMSESEADPGEFGAATAKKPTATQQTKGKKVDNPKMAVTTSGGASAKVWKRGAGYIKEDKGKAVQRAPADTTGVLMDADAWDDSVLIDAWDAAMEEYQILNGPEADWKKDPVHKDSIWYKSSPANLQWQDIKPAAAKANLAKPAGSVDPASTAEAGTHDEGDDQMEDGEEEQGQGVVGADAPQPAIAALPAAYDISTMSKDEIFQKAVEASYWAGYWAAAYHAAAGTHAEAET